MYRQRAGIDIFSYDRKTRGVVSLLVIISEMQMTPRCDSSTRTTFKIANDKHHHGCMGNSPTFLGGIHRGRV